MKFILALAATFALSSALAQNAVKEHYRPAGSNASDPEDPYTGYILDIQESLRNISQLNDGCRSCTSQTNRYLDLPTSETCRKQYRKLYKIGAGYDESNPPEINMSLYVGYLDISADPQDQYLAAAAKYQLTGGCAAGNFACGFKQDDDDATLFRKRMNVLGPDGQVYSRVVNLRIDSPSVSTSESYNSGAGKHQQEARSWEVSQNYLSSLQNDDVVLYIGHARKGGGPDFFQPVKDKKGNVNYNHYAQLRKEKRASFDEIATALRDASSPPDVVGIFACDSNKHFRSTLKEIIPNSGLVLSGSKTEDIQSAVSQAVGTLDSALGLRCEPDVSKAINTQTNRQPDKPGDPAYKPVTVDNFGK